MIDINKVIYGLEFTKAMITFNPSTGEDIEPEDLNEDNKITYDACVGAITLLKEREVKTGYWIDSAGNDKCSVCGEEYSDLYPDYGNTHFCPNCGAKMKGR